MRSHENNLLKEMFIEQFNNNKKNAILDFFLASFFKIQLKKEAIKEVTEIISNREIMSMNLKSKN